jgi:threonine dehydrogenase-like Zn-dependent dehydrogenase
MRAITVLPGQANSAALSDMPEPAPEEGAVEVEAVALGICGTDAEIVSGAYGWAPPGADRLILGHESLGRVVGAPKGGDLKPGDLVVGIVRRPDPVPCPYCAVGEWDMCRNGRYTERGIKQRHGYGAERWRIEPDFAVKVDPALGLLGVLLEPTSVVAKAWDHAERLGHRSAAWKPTTLLVTGAGPVGLLAALIGAEKGLDVHVFDRVTDGPKPGLVKDLGGTYHAGTLPPLADLAPDIIMECTGATPVIAEVVTRSAPSGIVCLAGVSSGGHEIQLDLGGLNRTMVLENYIIFGSVNANRRHYQAAAGALARADKAWLGRLVTRRVKLDDWKSALARQPDDVKVVVDFAA